MLVGGYIPLDLAGFRLSSPHLGRQIASRTQMDQKIREMLLNHPIVVSVLRNRRQTSRTRSQFQN